MTAFDSLFREEAAAARRQRLEGEILLSRPFRDHVLTGFLAAVMLALGLWVGLGTYTRSETARGLLVTARPIVKVVALRPGQLAALHVADGQRVRTGQVLATIMVEQAGEGGGSPTGRSLAALGAQEALLRGQEGLAMARGAAERDRLDASLAGLRAQRASLADQAALQQGLVASAQETFDRISQVVERGYVSRIEHERRRQALLVARAHSDHKCGHLD